MTVKEMEAGAGNRSGFFRLPQNRLYGKRQSGRGGRGGFVVPCASVLHHIRREVLFCLMCTSTERWSERATG